MNPLLVRVVVAVVCLPAGVVCAAAQTPASVRAAYGFDHVAATGAGQTIAIIVAYSDPSAAADLDYFNNYYGLAAPPSLTIVNQAGGTALPAADPTASHNWEIEIALDLQYAHAIAPGANLLLVEAESPTYGNLFAAINYAKSRPGVSTINMSFGAAEFSGIASFDGVFDQPANHAGVTFVAASGDSGSEDGTNFPASSPRVLAVGGTTLGDSGETAWSGSGGGTSGQFRRPAYQNGVNPSARRGVPDVAYDADPATGFRVYNRLEGSTATGDANFLQVGGTSAGSPQWSALIALADEERASAGLSPLNGDQTLSMLYALYNTPYYAMAFNDIASGSNGYNATAGYDLVTGLGSPRAEFLVPYLAGQILIPEPTALALIAAAGLLLRRRPRCPGRSRRANGTP